MKPVNVGVLAGNLGRRIRPKSLRAIVGDAVATKGALNPYTITASRIVKNLNRHFVFPFLQPAVVNPLGIDGDINNIWSREDRIRYIGSERVQVRSPMGMDAPSDDALVNGRDEILRFVPRTDLSTVPGELQYRVFDYRSFTQFIPQLIKDMSFLRPMYQSTINGPQDGVCVDDLVVLKNQRAWKLAQVRLIERKDYLARFYSPADFLTPRIGVSNEDLAIREREHSFVEDFEDRIDALNMSWITRPPSGRLSIGSAAQVYGLERHQRGDEYTRPLGYAAVIGLDELCAVVRPFVFGGERDVWGTVPEFAVPLSEVATLGSARRMTEDNLYDFYFADDAEIMASIKEVTTEEMDNPTVRGVISFCDMNRYRKLHNDLTKCPEVPPNLVAPQFIKILTENGLDGLERLAKLTGGDAVSIGVDMLVNDLVEAREYLRSESGSYPQFVPLADELVRSTTKFGSLDALLRDAGPKIRLYQMPRDGGVTLAHISSLDVKKIVLEDEKDWHLRVIEMVDSSFDTARWGEYSANGRHYRELLDYRHLERHPRRKRIREQELRRPFLSKDKVPGGEAWDDKDGVRTELYGVNYCILNKDRTVRYGRDEQQQMTSPGLEDIDERFHLQVSTDFQYRFIKDALERVKRHAQFEGKGRFFAGLPAIDAAVRKKTGDEEYHYSRFHSEFSVDLMSKMRPFYDGVRRLANTPALRDAIAVAALKDEPLLLEAFYDLEAMEKMIMLRDNYFRGNLDAKHQYLRQFGYQDTLPHSGFLDEFYRALAEIDMHHRGFPTNEDNMRQVSRARQDHYSGERTSSLGLHASPKAEALLGVMQQKIAAIGSSIPQLLTD